MIEEGRSPLTGTFRTNELIRGGVLAIGDGYRAKHSEFSSSGLPFARAGNVNNGFHLQEADLLPLSALPRIGAKVSHPGDVVFTSKGTVGRFSIVTTETPQFVYAPQLCYWRSLDRNTLDPQFLYSGCTASNLWNRCMV